MPLKRPAQIIPKIFPSRLKKNKINSCLNFSRKVAQNDYQTSEEYNVLKNITQQNFAILTTTIKNRFPEDQARLVKISEITSQTEKEFKEGTINPIPVLSQNGYAKLGKLSDLNGDGFYYVGVPLVENAPYDDIKNATPQAFIDHDISHAGILFSLLGLSPNEPNLYEKLKLLRDFKEFLYAEISNLQSNEGRKKKKTMNLIRYMTIHEGNSSLAKYTRRKDIFTELLYTIHFNFLNSFADYAAEKGLMEVTEGDSLLMKERKLHLIVRNALDRLKERARDLPRE